MAPEGMDLPANYEEEMADSRARLKRFARSGGLDMVFSGHIPNSRRALEATEYAEMLGKGEEFHRAAFDQLYGQGHDISKWEVLRSAASASGIDPDELQREVDTGRFRAIVDEKAEHARQIGIHAVPTYIINGRYRIVGAQPLEVFKQAIDEIAAREEES